MCDSDKKDPDRLHCVTKVCDKKGKEKNPTNHTGFSIILTVGKILPPNRNLKQILHLVTDSGHALSENIYQNYILLFYKLSTRI